MIFSHRRWLLLRFVSCHIELMSSARELTHSQAVARQSNQNTQHCRNIFHLYPFSMQKTVKTFSSFDFNFRLVENENVQNGKCRMKWNSYFSFHIPLWNVIVTISTLSIFKVKCHQEKTFNDMHKLNGLLFRFRSFSQPKTIELTRRENQKNRQSATMSKSFLTWNALVFLCCRLSHWEFVDCRFSFANWILIINSWREDGGIFWFDGNKMTIRISIIQFNPARFCVRRHKRIFPKFFRKSREKTIWFDLQFTSAGRWTTFCVA